jgi:NTE family protein
MSEDSIPIHLVLGSGGARGLTHIGVVRVLRERGYAIQSITGCSIGALIGALLVSGHLDEYEEWVRQLTRWDVFRFLDISLLDRAGMVKGDKLMDRLAEWLSGVQIQSLEIPLTVVATDIASRKEVWISRGDLLEAVRASIAVPGVFTPVVKHGRVLVDGGILNPLPVPRARMESSSITVAVSASGRALRHPYGDPPAVSSPQGRNPSQAAANDVLEPALSDQEEDYHQPIDGFLDSLQRFFGRERVDEDPVGGAATRESGGGTLIGAASALNGRSRPALTDVMLGMFNTMQDTIARHQLAANPPDILIDIPCNICESHEFHKANELVAAGEYWARKALEEQRDTVHR